MTDPQSPSDLTRILAAQHTGSAADALIALADAQAAHEMELAR